MGHNRKVVFADHNLLISRSSCPAQAAESALQGLLWGLKFTFFPVIANYRETELMVIRAETPAANPAGMRRRQARIVSVATD
jgi:hypothetical protein